MISPSSTMGNLLTISLVQAIGNVECVASHTAKILCVYHIVSKRLFLTLQNILQWQDGQIHLSSPQYHASQSSSCGDLL